MFMHLIMVLLALILSCSLRLSWPGSMGSYQQRWHSALLNFLVPPLLLIMTAVALVCMGPSGDMVEPWEGWLTCSLASGFLAMGGGWGLTLAIAGWRSVQQVKAYRLQEVSGYTSHILESPILFSAQVGFWHPALVVSQGLLDALDTSHLQAVLAHEQGHWHYRDTFWFFWLGWLRRFTRWLPNTDALWDELLLLREIRADQWAVQHVDQLVLAESLLQVVEAPLLHNEAVSAAFSCAAPASRLSERIDALLATSPPLPQPATLPWLWLMATCLPLFVIPFHY
jgi:Zn-dependent protease with chaperone function